MAKIRPPVATGHRRHALRRVHDLKRLCESALNQTPSGQRLDYWLDYHAQLVMVGKRFCRLRTPRCEDCPLQPLLPSNAKISD
jgi:endonuclease III